MSAISSAYLRLLILLPFMLVPDDYLLKLSLCFLCISWSTLVIIDNPVELSSLSWTILISHSQLWYQLPELYITTETAWWSMDVCWVLPWLSITYYVWQSRKPCYSQWMQQKLAGWTPDSSLLAFVYWKSDLLCQLLPWIPSVLRWFRGLTSFCILFRRMAVGSCCSDLLR